MNELGSMVLGALFLGACAGPSLEGKSSPSAAPASEAEAAQAIALARECWAREPWGMASAGFGSDRDGARAYSEGQSRTRYLVRLHEGFYLGRLPPPRPAGEVWIAVDLTTRSCAAHAPPAMAL